MTPERPANNIPDLTPARQALKEKNAAVQMWADKAVALRKAGASLDDLVEQFDESSLALQYTEYNDKIQDAYAAYDEWAQGGADVPNHLWSFLPLDERLTIVRVRNGEIPHPDAPVNVGKDRYIMPRKDDSGNFGPWFPRGAVSLAAGSSGHGKTTVMLRLLEALRNGQSYFGHPATTADYRIVLADRDKADLEESAEDSELDVNAILGRAVEVDLLDSKPAHALVTEWLRAWKEQGAVPDVVFIEGADLWCDGAEEKQPTLRFLKPLIQVARKWNIAIIASVGSPKQKAKDGYSLTRDKVFGSTAWGRTCSTILHVVLTDLDDPDSARQVSILPRKGRQERWYFTYEAGRPIFTDVKPVRQEPDGVAETQKQMDDKDAEFIAYLQTLPPRSVIRLGKLPHFGSRDTVRERCKRLSHPVTGWVEYDDTTQEWKTRVTIPQ